MNKTTFFTYPFLFLVICSFFSCSEKPGDLVLPGLTNPPIEAVDMNLVPVKDNATADGNEYVEFQFNGGPSVVKNYREVTFDISPTGRFTNGATTQKANIDVNGEAKIFAVSTVPGVTTITATVGNSTKPASARFLTSWPDYIVIEPDSSFLMPLQGAKTLVKARLGRYNGGVVSPGLTVEFDHSTSNPNQKVGMFLNTTPSNAAGLATAEFLIQDDSYHGNVNITGKVTTTTTPPITVPGSGTIRIR